MLIKSHFCPYNTGAMNDLNPSLSLGDEGIDTILRSLQATRERALSKFPIDMERTCYAMAHCVTPYSMPGMHFRSPYGGISTDRGTARFQEALLLRPAAAVTARARAHAHRDSAPARAGGRRRARQAKRPPTQGR